MRRPGQPSAPRTVARRVLERLGEALDALEKSLAALAADPDPSPERLHRLHADLRRLRVGFRLVRSLEPAAARARHRALDRRLAEIARRIGEVRDRDVQLALLAPGGGAPEEGDAPPGRGEPFPELVLRLKDDARIGRELLRAYVRAEKDSGLFAELRGLLGVAPTPGGLATFPREELDRMGARLLRAFRKARRRLTIRRAHDLRLTLRRMRYLIELLGTVPGAIGYGYPDRLVRLQRLLGRLHDREILTDSIEELPAALRSAPWARRMRSEHRTLRRRIEEELGKRSLRQALRSLADPASAR